MSAQAWSYVVKNSNHKGGALLLLLMIANHAHADGTNAYPSVKTLAEECRMSVRQVIRLVAILEKSGELIIERSHGRHHHNYAINMSRNTDKVSPSNPVKMSGSTLTSATANPDKSSAPTLTNPAPHYINHSSLTKEEPKEAPSVELYREFFPKQNLSNYQIDCIGQKVSDIDKWTQALTDWKTNGWIERNVGNMLDYYERLKNGTVKQFNSGKRHPEQVKQQSEDFFRKKFNIA
jgi:hypothetical protein